MDDCIFCSIIRREAQASVVYEDDEVLAFMDIFPVNPGHTLVIPKGHYPSLRDLPPAIGGRIFQVAMQIERAIRNSDIPDEGTNLLLADGAVAGQEVFHLHLHVIPRLSGDRAGFRFSSANRAMPNRFALDGQAAKIKAGM
jgi:diadenosine tetraphosphate (Ap4A) HIT family hydrolase